MNQGELPPAGSDPERLSLESLERQLRALPPPPLPDALQAKLIAAIPMSTVAGPPKVGFDKHWPWIVVVGLACIGTSTAIYSWLNRAQMMPPKEAGQNVEESSVSSQGDAPASREVQKFENLVRFDPYNADAWFNLAKAQANLQRSEAAISSAQKAIDIGRSRNRTDFVMTVETWLRSYRTTSSQRPNR